MVIHRLILTAGLMCCAPAFAADIPKIDVEGNCARLLADFGGPEKQRPMYNYCLQQEQSSYEIASLMWPSVHEKAKDKCAKIATALKAAAYENMVNCLITWGDHYERLDMANRRDTFHY